jgi:plasmid stability protein
MVFHEFASTESDTAQLTVRTAHAEIAAALKARAATSGRSADAEHRLILQEASRPRHRPL